MMDGDTTALPFVPELLDSVALEVNQRVWVQLYGRRVIILGYSALTPPTPPAAQGYTTYSPELANISIGSTGVTYGWYTRFPMSDGGAFITGGFYIVFGGSPISISTTCYVGLPEAAWVPAAGLIQLAVGTWIFRDQASTLHHFSGALGTYQAAGTHVSLSGAWDGTAPQSRVTTGKPFTVADTDILSAEFSYRAAPP
jgi:hypothetical protein